MLADRAGLNLPEITSTTRREGVFVHPQPARRHISLRLSLIVLVLVCIVPAILMCAYLFHANYQLEKQKIYADTELFSRQIVSELDRELAAIESGLRVLATAESLKNGDLQRFHQIARDALKSQVVYNYILTDRQGRQVMNTVMPYGSKLPQTGTPAALEEVFLSGKTVLSDLFIGPVTGKPVIAMGVPVFSKENEIIYSLNIGLSPERLSKIIGHQNLPEGWLAAILDSKGVIVGRSRDAEKFIGQKAVPELLEGISKQHHGTMEALTKEGIPVVTAFSSSVLWHWDVVTGAPKSIIEAEMYRMLAWLALAIGVFIPLGTWLARRLAQRVISSVQGLNDAALALCSGKPITLPEIQLEEAEAVGLAIIEASQLMAEVHHRAYHDPLTRLGNRALFYELVQHQQAVAERERGSFAILAIDLDHFKLVNDTEGHATGDRLLQAVAERIETSLRASDAAARMGGDEFSVLLVNAKEGEACDTARRLLECLAEPYPGVTTRISASIGIAVFPDAGSNLAELLEKADRALYAAKHSGRNNFIVAPM